MDPDKFFQSANDSFKFWAEAHYFKIALFNIILIFLLLLRSAGYFEPYFLLSINLITFVSMVLSIFLLNSNSRSMFAISLLFWALALFLRVEQIGVWAERSALYSYQALFIGIVLLIYETSDLSLIEKFKNFRKKNIS